MRLDFFLLFSSVASITGSPGQSGYTAANAFLDVLAHFRRARNLPALSVNWGAWEGDGMAARVEAEGQRRSVAWVKPMPACWYLDRLEAAVAEGLPQATIVDGDWSQAPSFPRLVRGQFRRPEHSPAKAEDGILNRLSATPQRNRRKVMVEYLREQARSVLGLSGSTLFIDEREALMKIGMDSLMAVEYRNNLAAALGRPLSATLVFDHPTIASLADFLSGGLSQEPVGERDALLEDIDSLSDAEAAELLQEELEQG